jgi:integrase/recombinase XerD
MLSVKTRHYPPCPQTHINHRKCRCPKWMNGTLPNGKFIRQSAKTRSWENAERKARMMETTTDSLNHEPDQGLSKSAAQALQAFEAIALRMGLTVNRDKSQITKLIDGFNFIGV